MNVSGARMTKVAQRSRNATVMPIWDAYAVVNVVRALRPARFLGLATVSALMPSQARRPFRAAGSTAC